MLKGRQQRVYRKSLHSCTTRRSGILGVGERRPEAAGIASRLCQRWTKAKVVEALRRRHVEGPPLSHVWKDDKPLFRAAVASSAIGTTHCARLEWNGDRIESGRPSGCSMGFAHGIAGSLVSSVAWTRAGPGGVPALRASVRRRRQRASPRHQVAGHHDA